MSDQTPQDGPDSTGPGEEYDHYVDEHGNPIEHFIDEHGNPVDEHGNPLEFFDEHGNQVDQHGNLLDDDVTYVDDPHALGVVSSGRRRSRLVGVGVLIVCALIVLGAVAFFLPSVRSLVGGFTAAKDYPGPGTGSIEFVIKEGDTGRTIGNNLEKAGVVKNASAFLDAVSEQNASNKLQPGTFKLKKEMTSAGALELLLSKDSRINIVVRVREGLWKSEVFQVITKETGFTTEQLTAAAKDPAVGLPAEAQGDPEGYLFPATYTYDPKVKPVEILKTMVSKYKAEMTKAAVPADKQRRVLILASMVQAEASKPDDFPKVARVIENRLEKYPTQPLGFDTTVNFAVQKRGFDLTKTDLNSNSPYNTRKHTGLPPGPIDSPGAAAIEAAAKPAQGDWLYFVTTNPDTGETLFTSNYDEFLKGKREFEQWMAKNKNS